MKRLSDFINNILKNESIVAYVTIMVFILIIATLYGGDKIAVQIQAIANSLLVIGLILTIIQIRQSKKELKSDHEWNRRHFAMQEVGRVRRESKVIRDRLTELTRNSHNYIKEEIQEKTPDCLTNCKLIDDPACVDSIKFSDRFLKAGTLTVEEIHKWVCKYKCDNDSSPVMIMRDKGENRGDCQMTQRGELIRSDLIELINLYEEFAVGIRSQTIDEDIARDLYCAPIIKNYVFFKDYIEHLKSHHKATNFAVNFDWLYEEWKEKSNKTKMTKTED